jgi:Uncharacterized protein conserved in bacteria (DUF2252)
VLDAAARSLAELEITPLSVCEPAGTAVGKGAFRSSQMSPVITAGSPFVSRCAARTSGVTSDRWPETSSQKDWKFSVPIEQMLPVGMTIYARLCGWTLARAHARSGDRIALAAYLGGSGKFDQAIADFAETYADQNERDYAALQAAVKDGKAEAATEI